MASGHTLSLTLPTIGGKIQKLKSGRFKKARRKADLTPNHSTQLLTINSATLALKRSSRTTDHSCKVPQTPPLDNGIKCGYAYAVSVPRKLLTLSFFLSPNVSVKGHQTSSTASNPISQPIPPPPLERTSVV